MPQQKKGKAEEGNIAYVDDLCQKQIHNLFTNGELKRRYNTVELLKADPRVQKWIEWRQKHPNPTHLAFSGKGGFHR